MSDRPALDSRAGAHMAAAACLGVCLLAGTALPGILSSGPPFPAVGHPVAVADRDSAMPAVGGRAPAAPAPADRHAATTGSDRAALPQAIDINRAAAADLQSLPGIGPMLARRVVAHREAHGPFRSPADLLQVPGVGAKRFARLQGLIRAAEAP